MALSLQIKNLSKSFEDQVIFQNLNFNFDLGQLYSLTGPSGKGKTTFLNCLAGLDKDYGGEIFLNEKLLDHKSRSRLFLPNLGFMFQDLALWPHKTIHENLILRSKILGNDHKKIFYLADHYLERFNLQAFKKHYPNQISGGQKQRIAFIRSVIHEPKILLLDEPSSSLDKENKQIMADILNQSESKQRIALVVSHDQEFLSMLGQGLIGFCW